MTTSQPLSNSNTRRHECALAVMAKAPRAGEVKTRLVPPLDHEEAANLSACFLADTAANMHAVAARHAADCIAVYTPIGAEETLSQLLPANFSLLAQQGATLGDRLLLATEELLARGYKSVCLINGDTPTLPPVCLATAIEHLRRPGERVVLGPADDGGYYLIGLTCAHRRLFADIPWSTARVCALTVERAREINLAVELLRPWYDLDDATSLSRLCAELFAANGKFNAPTAHAGYEAPHTRDYLACLIAAGGRERIWPATPVRLSP
jgi:uncharacterized protein